MNGLVGFVAGVAVGTAFVVWADSAPTPECFCPKPPPAKPLYLKDFCPGGHVVWNGKDTISCVVP